MESWRAHRDAGRRDQNDRVADVVLMIGGSASVGKSRLATELAALLQCRRVIRLDDVRDRQGAVRPFHDQTVWDRTGEELLELLLQQTRTLHRPLVEVIARTHKERIPAVIEGEGVEPDVVAGWRSAREVRSVFIVETDAHRLYETFASRPSADRFLALSESRRAAVVEMSLLYGAYLAREAERHDLPWIKSQPWSTLCSRAQAALSTG